MITVVQLGHLIEPVSSFFSTLFQKSVLFIHYFLGFLHLQVPPRASRTWHSASPCHQSDLASQDSPKEPQGVQNEHQPFSGSPQSSELPHWMQLAWACDMDQPCSTSFCLVPWHSGEKHITVPNIDMKGHSMDWTVPLCRRKSSVPTIHLCSGERIFYPCVFTLPALMLEVSEDTVCLCAVSRCCVKKIWPHDSAGDGRSSKECLWLLVASSIKWHWILVTQYLEIHRSAKQEVCTMPASRGNRLGQIPYSFFIYILFTA